MVLRSKTKENEPKRNITFKAPHSDYLRLVKLRGEAEKKVDSGEIEEYAYLNLSECLRKAFKEYLEKLENLLQNGTNMRGK